MRGPTTFLGILLMESQGLAPSVRTASFSSVQVWSKLYRVGPYFLDLNLRPGEKALRLQGELLPDDDVPLPGAGTVELYDNTGTLMATSRLSGADEGGSATFSLDLDDTGEYHLKVVYDGGRLSIAGLVAH